MNKRFLTVFFTVVALFTLTGLTACDKSGIVESVEQDSFLNDFEYTDMSGYDGLKNYNRDTKFKSVSVRDVDKAIKAGESFVLYCGYKDCPWCNSVLTILNDTAIEYGMDIAYIDTRKDPSWKSNTDMDDYDVFVNYFGNYLDTDSDGKKHLYVPHVFFVRHGVVVKEHPGTVTGHNDSSDPLTSEQKEELHEIYTEGFKEVTDL